MKFIKTIAFAVGMTALMVLLRQALRKTGVDLANADEARRAAARRSDRDVVIRREPARPIPNGLSRAEWDEALDEEFQLEKQLAREVGLKL